VSEEQTPSPVSSDGTITIRIVRRALPDKVNDYEAILREIVAYSRTFPGFVDGRIIRPPRGNNQFTTILTFQNQERLEAWKESARRLELIAQAELVSAEDPFFANITGTAQAAPLAMALTPLEQFVRTSVSGIGLLLAGTVAAIILANSPLADRYESFWNTTLTIGAPGFQISESLRHWVNDALMALFFFIVGLEIKREVLVGEMRYPRQAALAIAAAVGGVLLPAAIFIAINWGQPGQAGWGVPIGTDTAFALGIVTLFGSRVRPLLLVFLTAFAIVDDILAVGVIAIFYTDQISLPALALALVFLAALVMANRAGFHRWPIYALLGLCVWVTVFESGVHATAAGVLVALTVPARSWINPSEFLVRGRKLIDDFEAACFIAPSILTNEPQQIATQQLGKLVEEVETPLTYFQRLVNPWVSYGILPLFAFANAGIPLVAGLGDALGNSVTWGVAAGLIIGKPVGITLFAWLAVRLGIATLPRSITWAHVIGVACLGGFGFTISLFITELAFGHAAEANAARIGIFFGSLVAGTLGYFVLRAVLPPSRDAAG
jgi:Na+:H+ antiporter, NhaA family